MEDLKLDIQILENTYMYIINAMSELNDYDGFEDEFIQLDLIAQAIDEKKNSLSVELEDLEEQAYMQENEQQWKKEQKEQDYEYWQSQF